MLKSRVVATEKILPSTPREFRAENRTRMEYDRQNIAISEGSVAKRKGKEIKFNDDNFQERK